MRGPEDDSQLARGQVTRTADVEERQRVEQHGVDAAQLLGEKHEEAREEGSNDSPVPQDIPRDLREKGACLADVSRLSRATLADNDSILGYLEIRNGKSCVFSSLLL